LSGEKFKLIVKFKSEENVAIVILETKWNANK